MDSNLIFDIGFHRGEDTRYYLARGYRVVAVDADGDAIAYGRSVFSAEVAEGRLIFRQAVVSDQSIGDVPFYISPNSQWSSVCRDIAERNGRNAKVISVPSITLDDLMEVYGVPCYCKIDIEGNDFLALRGIVQRKPSYISVETECLGEHGDVSAVTYTTLDALKDLGYTRFKLVDQETLTVLGSNSFYTKQRGGRDMYADNYRYARSIFGFKGNDISFSRLFPGSSGPFGDDLRGEWADYQTARELIAFHKEEQLRLQLVKWGFWCDWHATF